MYTKDEANFISIYTEEICCVADFLDDLSELIRPECNKYMVVYTVGIPHSTTHSLNERADIGKEYPTTDIKTPLFTYELQVVKNTTYSSETPSRNITNHTPS